MRMFERWRRKRQNREVVEQLYDTLVARARRPELYLDGGLPDTVMGRYEAIGIEVFLLLDRCRREPELGRLSQDLVDRFMLDIDHSLREIGIGYQGVPRRMRRLANRFYTRVREFESPLAAGDETGLEGAILRRTFSGNEESRDAARFLARHMIASAHAYAGVSAADILSGQMATGPGGSA